jgi:hypothetical protein
LSGGLALVEHELTIRPTKDIDLFTSTFDSTLFDRAVTEAVGALEEADYRVSLSTKTDTFARIIVAHDEDSLTVDLGYDYREYDAVIMDVGPVLDKRDAILNKVSALYARMLPRDYIDTYNSIQSGYMPKSEILKHSQERDEGFLLEHFIDALRRIQTLTLEGFSEYGITPEEFSDIRATMLSWADEIKVGTIKARVSSRRT